MAINHRMRKKLHLNVARKTRPRCEKCVLNPQSCFKWHFTCLKSRFPPSIWEKKKRKEKSFLAPKGWAPFFWHELLNLPVSSLVGIHATKNQAQYLLSQHSIPNQCTSWLCFSSYFTTLYKLFKCWHAYFFSRKQKEEGKKSWFIWARNVNASPEDLLQRMSF